MSWLYSAVSRRSWSRCSWRMRCSFSSRRWLMWMVRSRMSFCSSSFTLSSFFARFSMRAVASSSRCSSSSFFTWISTCRSRVLSCFSAEASVASCVSRNSVLFWSICGRLIDSATIFMLARFLVISKLRGEASDWARGCSRLVWVAPRLLCLGELARLSSKDALNDVLMVRIALSCRRGDKSRGICPFHFAFPPRTVWGWELSKPAFLRRWRSSRSLLTVCIMRFW